MRVSALAIPEVLLIEPEVFNDKRGFFFELFRKNAFTEATGLDVDFVQDNCSRSSKGVLRGLHYQIQQVQGKLLSVVCGKVFTVAVDIRRTSASFGKWVHIELSEDNHKQLWIPAGFAHGFFAMSDRVDFLYKTTDYYARQHERCIAWNDPTLGIQWPLEGQTPILSASDERGKIFAEAEVF